MIDVYKSITSSYQYYLLCCICVSLLCDLFRSPSSVVHLFALLVQRAVGSAVRPSTVKSLRLSGVCCVWRWGDEVVGMECKRQRPPQTQTTNTMPPAMAMVMVDILLSNYTAP